MSATAPELADRLRRLHSVCRAAGIEVTYAPRAEVGAWAYVTWDSDARRYRIVLSHEACEVSEEAALAHELAHVLRGDLVRLHQEGLDARRWNISADALINVHMAPEAAEAFQAITYQGVREYVGPDRLPETPVGSRRVYDVLAEAEQAQAQADGNGEAADGGPDGGDGNGQADGPGGGGGPGRAPEAHDALRPSPDGDGPTPAEQAATVVRARAADPEAVRDLTGDAPLVGGRAPGQGGAGRRGWPPVEARPSPLSEVLRRLAGHQRRLAQHRTRTWLRPGRMPGLTRGVTRPPVLHVLLALDVSGSTAAIEPILAGVMAAVQHDARYSVQWAVWADRAATCAPPPAPRPDVGGGTAVRSLAELVRQRAGEWDIVVVATDGEVADWPTSAPTAAPWIVVSPLRPTRWCEWVRLPKGGEDR
jgi:hypothetical protein